MTLRKTVEKLSESRMRAIVLWPTDHPYIIRDTGVRGLLLRKGLKRTTWHFYNENSHRSWRAQLYEPSAR